MPILVLITCIQLLCFGILVEGKCSAWAEPSVAPQHFAVVPLATGGSTAYAVLPLCATGRVPLILCSLYSGSSGR